MSRIARRMTILTLMMTIFAFGFSALVSAPSQRQVRVHAGTVAPCYHPATEGCVTAL